MVYNMFFNASLIWKTETISYLLEQKQVRVITHYWNTIWMNLSYVPYVFSKTLVGVFNYAHLYPL